ncbi:MAG: zinc ribbon domain-containing protein [Candidatus Baldrarchaeia archaeon]
MEEASEAKGTIIIRGRAYPAEKVLRALLNQSLVEIKVDGSDLIIGRERIQPIYKSVIEKAMALTCYGSLAYCCSLDKRCINRDKALELLGLTHEDYQKLKEEFHKRIIEYAKGHFHSEPVEEKTELPQMSYGIEQSRQTEGTTDLGFLFQSNESPKEASLSLKDYDESQASSIKFCMYCGTQLPSDAKFCYKCGKMVT